MTDEIFIEFDETRDEIFLELDETGDEEDTLIKWVITLCSTIFKDLRDDEDSENVPDEELHFASHNAAKMLVEGMLAAGYTVGKYTGMNFDTGQVYAVFRLSSPVFEVAAEEDLVKGLHS